MTQCRRFRQRKTRSRNLSKASVTLSSLAHVDLRHAIGIAGETHFLARQFRHASQECAGLPDQLFHRIVWIRASQMWAVLSPDAVTMRDPSGLKAADCTKPSWRRTAISLAVAASQMRAHWRPAVLASGRRRPPLLRGANT